MTESAQEPQEERSTSTSAGNERLINAATPVGMLLAIVGVIDGLVMVLKRRETTCADGTFFPEGTTDFRCFTHPQAGEGIGIIDISMVLGVLILLAVLIAQRLSEQH